MGNDIIKIIRNGATRYIGDSKSRQNTADEFSTTTSYNSGNYVLYDGELYRFTSNHAAGNWNNEEVVKTKIANEMNHYIASTTDLTDGVSELGLGELYFYYEV